MGVLLGVVVAGLVHTGKATARPAANLSTFGVGAPVVSTVEDGASVGLSLIALFAPLLVIVALLVLVVGFGWLWWRIRAWRRRGGRPGRRPRDPPGA